MIDTYKQLTLFDEPTIPSMPAEYVGSVSVHNGEYVSESREWTKQEIEWVSELRSRGWSAADIAESIGRTEASVSIKLKRIGKSNKTYNSDHIADKYRTNRAYLKQVHPKTLLDMFAGEHSWWKQNSDGTTVTTNDQNTAFHTDYNERAEMLIHRLYYEGLKYDVIDLDPFGSAFDCLDLAIKMAQRGIIITLGEMGHKRFKRLDFVRRYYGITSLEDFTTQRIVEEIQRIGARNKKLLTPVFIKEWRMISRVYFTIQPLKITEQWEKK